MTTTTTKLDTFVLAAALLTAGFAQAQAPAKPAASAPAPAASAAPAASKAKKELVAKVLELQKPGIEGAARVLGEQPALQMLQRAAAAMQNMPADKREALGREIQADAKRYADDAVPLLNERAVKLGPTTIGPILEEKFSEAELKQLIAILESPVNRKFQLLGSEMQRALTEKLVADTRSIIEPKLRTLEQTIAGRLNGPAAPAAGASAASAAPR